MQTKPHESVPFHLRNATTSLMKDLGYGAGYEYAHDKRAACRGMATFRRG